MCLFLVFVWLNTLFLIGQVRKENELYTKLKKLKLFKSNRQDVESLFKYTIRKETDGSEGYKTVYYDLRGAKLTVDYSTGQCSEHRSKQGYDVSRDTVFGVSLSYRRLLKFSSFDFDLTRFEKYAETDNNAIIYTNEELGIELIGGKDVIRRIEFSPTEIEEERYRCKESFSKASTTQN